MASQSQKRRQTMLITFWKYKFQLMLNMFSDSLLYVYTDNATLFHTVSLQMQNFAPTANSATIMPPDVAPRPWHMTWCASLPPSFPSCQITQLVTETTGWKKPAWGGTVPGSLISVQKYNYKLNVLLWSIWCNKSTGTSAALDSAAL